MATTIQYPNESTTIDALWTILNQQTESVKRALAERLNQSLSVEKVVSYKKMDEALEFVKTLSIKGGNPVPADEKGIEALINDKYL